MGMLTSIRVQSNTIGLSNLTFVVVHDRDPIGA